TRSSRCRSAPQNRPRPAIPFGPETLSRRKKYSPLSIPSSVAANSAPQTAKEFGSGSAPLAPSASSSSKLSEISLEPVPHASSSLRSRKRSCAPKLVTGRGEGGKASPSTSGSAGVLDPSKPSPYCSSSASTSGTTSSPYRAKNDSVNRRIRSFGGASWES